MRHYILLCLFGFAAALPLRAAEGPDPAQTRMREALRNAMLQLRTVENEKAALQATNADLDQKNKALTTQVETLTKQMVADKDAADQATANLNARIAAQEAEISRLKEGVQKLDAAGKQMTEIARAKEAQRAKLADEVIGLQRRVADQQVKNAAMFKLGNEILARYEKFGLGDALTAREPFVGTTRVKFQNLIQDYGDKLAEQKIKPIPESPEKPAATPAKNASEPPPKRSEKKPSR